MEQDNVKWKYNKDKHEVVEQPTMQKPLWVNGDYNRYQRSDFMKDVACYDKHIASRRSIPVSGKVDWKDGEDVTGMFKIEVIASNLSLAIPYRKAYNSAKEMFNDIANGRDDEPENQSQEQDNVSGGEMNDWEKRFKLWLLQNGEDLIAWKHDLIISHVKHDFVSPILQQNKELQGKIQRLIKALEQIEQMRDPGSYENAIINMKQIASKAFKP